MHEITKMGLQKSGRVGSYPPLVLNLAPSELERVCETIVESGHQGTIVAGVDLSRKEVLTTVRKRVASSTVGERELVW